MFCSTGLFHPLAEITFIQIGQGDAILIKDVLSSSVIVVDTGEEKNYALLRDALHARSIQEIDYLILTHMDSDHAGGYSLLKKEFNVKNLIQSVRDISTNNFYLKSLNDRGYTDDNDNSLVYVVLVKKLNILLNGDISSKVEQDLIQKYNLKLIDIVKLAHHGSKTSTSEKFLASIQPKIAINSSGLGNKFNHPSPEIVRRLNDFSIKFFDTQSEGDISIFFLRNSNFFITSTRKIGIIDTE